jgi:hypothetical protein
MPPRRLTQPRGLGMIRCTSSLHPLVVLPAL